MRTYSRLTNVVAAYLYTSDAGTAELDELDREEVLTYRAVIL